MYTREESSRIKQSFWTAFGRYMQPVLSAEGLSVSWLNYKTGVPGIHFKMDADRDQAVIMILLSNKNMDLQQSQYEQFLQLKAILEESLGEDDWTWEQDKTSAYGANVSSISKQLKGVNVLRQEDWATIISFLKPRIVALDEFWSMAKSAFE